jgi:hypothetical protein
MLSANDAAGSRCADLLDGLHAGAVLVQARFTDEQPSHEKPGFGAANGFAYDPGNNRTTFPMDDRGCAVAPLAAPGRYVVGGELPDKGGCKWMGGTAFTYAGERVVIADVVLGVACD